REPAPVDDARVVEGIAVDVVAAADGRRDRVHVRLVARGEKERRLRALERRQLRLDLGMQLEVPGDEPRGAGAAAPALDRGARGRLHRGVGSEPEVVVGGEEEDATADRKSTRLNSSHVAISYAVFCLKKKSKPD